MVIDYQPSQFAAVRSMDPDLLLENIVSTVKTAKAFGVPIVHSTVNVASGRQQPTVPELAELLEEYPPIDRTTLNSWEDADFLAAVRATGRRKLILCALWTEICMAFPALDAMREGYDVYPVVDAIGGTSEEAHRAGVQRVVRAGANPVSWVALACELQRDWARVETVQQVVEIVSMRSAAPAWKPTAPASSGSSKPEPIRSAGSRSRASFSATGHAKKRWPTSSRSCSPSDC